jgi:tRNA threonylcarbamoyladenosine biosynthesis protein TsaB
MLLAIDTSTAQIGLALYDGTSVPGEFVWHSGLHHTQELAPALQELLRRVRIKITSITSLGVALGPGSFTSLRVGLAFAKGLVLARHIPVVGVPTLDFVAKGYPFPESGGNAPRRLAAVLEAGRKRLAVGWYDAGENGWQADGEAGVTTADELAESIHSPVVVIGEMNEDAQQRLRRKFKNVTLASPAQCVRRPGLLAELAWKKLQEGQTDSAATLAPIYLHVTSSPPV